MPNPDPHAFIDHAISTLKQALSDRESDFRNVQLATLTPEGRPGLRTLVLRNIERSPARAEIHSDARAAKIRDITYAGHVKLLAWSAPDQLQLCFEGFAHLHRANDIARARWDELSENGRATYGLAAQPGHPVDSPGDRTHLPPDQQFEQFTVITVDLATVDVLRLEEKGGQTRAFARFVENDFEATWVGP